MFWKYTLVFVICQTVYCQSAIESSENLQKNSINQEDDFSKPTTENYVQVNVKNDSRNTENNLEDELHYEDESKGYWASDEPYVSESSINNIKNDSDDSNYANFKATDQIIDRLPAEPIQNNESMASQFNFQRKFPEDRNDSSQADLTNTQSKVVISQAVKPSTFNLFNSKQEEPEPLSDRSDKSFSISKDSQKRVGEYGRHLSSNLETQRRVPSQFNSEIASNSPFTHQGGSSLSEISGKVDTGLQKLFYKPFTHKDSDSKLTSIGGDFPGKSTLFSDVDSHQYSRARPEHGDEDSHLYDSDRQKNPFTRKVTIVKEKTMRSVSKTEEQESVNVPEKPQERFSSGESIILKAQTTGNDALDHPKSRTKEETIVLVEGSHIPGKNYGTEDDLFGYHYDFYDENSKSPKSGQFKDIAKSGDNSHTSHRIQHSNHGNGVSTQFFSSSPPSNLKESQSDVNIPEIHYESIGKGLPVDIQFKQDNEGGLNSGHGTVHFVPETEIDQTPIKCHHNHEHSVGNEPDVKHEEIDPNQLYIDAHTGQLIKFVPEDQVQTHFPNPTNNDGNQLFKKKETWPSQNLNDKLDVSNYPNNDFSQHSIGNYNNKGKIKIRSTPEFTDLSNTDLSSNSAFNKPNNEHNYQKQDISNKNIQFDVPSEEIKLKSDADLNILLDTHFTQNGLKGIGNVNNGNVGDVLYAENQFNSNQNNAKYGQKLNIGGSDFSSTNGKDGIGHNFKSFPQVSSDLLQNYGQNNDKSFQSSSGILNQPDNVNLEEHNFGAKSGRGSFKGSNNNHQGLFSKSKGNSYIPRHNEDTDTYKNVYFEFPTKKGNKNLNIPTTNGNSGLDFHLPTGNNKGTEFIITDDQNEGHNLFDCTKSQNHFDGHSIETPSGQSYNKGSGIDIRKHPNYMVSLQNLNGFQSKGLLMGNGLGGAKKKSVTRFQTLGYSKGNNEYLPKPQFNFKAQPTPQFQKQFKIKGQESPNNSLKDFSFQNSGINNNQQYGWQNNGKFNGLSIDSPGIVIGQHGDNNLHGLMQQHDHNFQQNSRNTFNGIHKQQEPAEYILVELDDNNNNNNNNIGHTDSEIESYYRQYENNFKGEQVDLVHANSPNGHSFSGNGNSNKQLQSPNIRYIVEGGKDIAFPLRRLATTGFHMARSVLPLMSNRRPKSIQGNINFGLQFSKRKGPSRDNNKILEAARN